MEYAELKKQLRGRVQEKMDFAKDFTDAEVEEAGGHDDLSCGNAQAAEEGIV